jgi:DNA-binding NarL/FixJ family response regulator
MTIQVEDVLVRYRERVAEFDRIAARRSPSLPQQRPLADLRSAEPPSRREVDVLRFVADGFSNKEIARELVLSEETVKSHIRNLLIKLQARNRAHAVAAGIERGLVEATSARRAAARSRTAARAD